jgi:serine/threonine-protein kinase
VAQKYRLERLLGSGGMGEVYLAFHEQLGRRVAIKVLREQALLEPDLRGRFQREAMAAARLANDHIARVFDIGELDNGAPFMVMEYLEGHDLAAHLQQRGALPVPEVLDLLWQICTGIGVAHAAGIVHRDLKPANLFLLPRPQGGHLLKILDFGIAKAPELQGSIHTHLPSSYLQAHPTSLTQTSMVLGSAKYMAPEQMESAKYVDARADIWSLGVIGYRMLTGRLPFEGGSFEELFLAMSARRMIPLGQLRPDAPPALVAAIEWCLQPSRDQRWPSVAALQTSLADARPWPAIEPLPRPSFEAFAPSSFAGSFAQPTSHPVLPATPPVRAPSAWGPGRTALVALAGGLVLAALGGAGVVGVLQSRSSSFSASLSLKDLRHVEPVELLPLARAKARGVSPSAELQGISVVGGQEGSVNLVDSSIVYIYRTPGAAHAALSLVARGGQLLWQPSSGLAGPGSVEPRCSFAQAWQAASAAGFPVRQAEQANYGISKPNIWFFSTIHGAGGMIEIDGATCAKLQMF